MRDTPPVMPRSDRILILLIALLLTLLLFFWALASPTTFRLFFSWPGGGVWSNLVASALLGGPAVYALLHRLARQHHEHLLLLNHQHAHHMEILRAQHEEMLQTVRTADHG